MRFVLMMGQEAFPSTSDFPLFYSPAVYLSLEVLLVLLILPGPGVSSILILITT